MLDKVNIKTTAGIDPVSIDIFVHIRSSANAYIPMYDLSKVSPEKIADKIMYELDILDLRERIVAEIEHQQLKLKLRNFTNETK